MATVSGVEGLAVGTAEIAIIDNDGEATGILLLLSPDRLKEGAGPSRVTITARPFGGTFSTAVTVLVSTDSESTASTADVGGLESVFSITIPARQTSETLVLTLEPFQDSLSEDDEKIIFSGVVDDVLAEISVTGAEITIINLSLKLKVKVLLEGALQ